MSEIVTARAYPRIWGGVARLPNGRTEVVRNSMGLRIPPNAEVKLLKTQDGYEIIGYSR
jgi:hypothetical protein